MSIMSIIRQYSQMEELNHHLNQLKGLVSLRYVDPAARSKYLQTISSPDRSQTDAQQCRNYLVKIEELHEKMMGEVSQFINIFTPLFGDLSQQIETISQESLESNKMHELQLKDLNSQMMQMNDKMMLLTHQLHDKEEFIRQLSAKLEEKEVYLEQREKEDQEYLRKIESDFNKQQKALQESMMMIDCKDEQILHLRQELALMHEQAIESARKSPSVLRSHRQSLGEPEGRSPSARKLDESYSVVQCSLINSSNRSHQGLSQFEEVKEEGRGEDWGINRGETIKEMLNLSLEKQYQLHYNQLETIGLASKENCRKDWNRDSKSMSDDKKPNWNMNQSIELIPCSSKNGKIGEFRLPADPSMRPDNPYYSYFLIASQNAKIRSASFEEASRIPTDSEWYRLNQMKVPLHLWETELQAFLKKKAEGV